MKVSGRALFGILLLSGLSGLPSLRAAEGSQEVEGEAVVGPQWYASEDPSHSAKFSEYRDVPNGFVIEQFRFAWKPKPAYFMDFAARDVSQLDQRLGLELGKRDLWRFHFSWAENPRRWTDQAHMLFTDQGEGVFTLNDSFQREVRAAPATADTSPADGQWDAGTKGALIKSAIQTSAGEVFVGSRRKTGDFGVEFTPTRNWTFDIGAQRERRSGTTPQSLGMYFQLAPAEVAAPLDFRTDDARAGVEYAQRSWTVGAQLFASKFETGIDAITWDDQLFLVDTAVNATTANPARGRLSPWSDSDLWKWVVYGGVSMAGHSRLNATFSQSETTQNDPFLPKTTNTLLAPDPLPAASLDGKYKDRLGSVNLASRPLSWFRLNAWYRDFNHDNQTPSFVFTDYVMTDFQIPLCGNANSCGSLANRIQRRNIPYAYEKSNAGASFGFTPRPWLDATVGYERETIQRNVSAVTRSDEDIFKLALDFDASEWLTVRTTLRHQERRADDYNAEYTEESFPIGETYVAPANQGERRFIWTDRDRDTASLLVEASPKPTYSIYAEATYGKDEYFDPLTGKKIGESITVQEDRDFNGVDESISLLLAGRIDDKNTTYTLGGTVAPSARLDLYADYTWEIRDYGMASRFRTPVSGIGSDNPLDDWGSDTRDRYNTANLGFDAGLTGDRKWRLNGSLSQSVGTGDIETHFVPGGNASGDTTLAHFPQLKTTLSIAQLGLDHAVRNNLDFSFRYWFERWHEDNFASDFSQPYMGDPGNDAGSKEAIFLGLDFANYTNHILSFLLRYRF